MLNPTESSTLDPILHPLSSILYPPSSILDPPSSILHPRSTSSVAADDDSFDFQHRFELLLPSYLRYSTNSERFRLRLFRHACCPYPDWRRRASLSRV